MPETARRQSALLVRPLCKKKEITIVCHRQPDNVSYRKESIQYVVVGLKLFASCKKVRHRFVTKKNITAKTHSKHLTTTDQKPCDDKQPKNRSKRQKHCSREKLATANAVLQSKI